jgi:cell division protein FtsZ
MQDEVRVTVVATGLNRVAGGVRAPLRDREAAREPVRQPVKLVRNATTGQPDFDAMANVPGAPTAGYPGLRGRSADSSPATALADLPSDQSYLDIPAFLRRQAD